MNTPRVLERMQIAPRCRPESPGYLYLLIISGGLFAPFALAPRNDAWRRGVPTTARSLPQALVCSRWRRPLIVYTCEIGFR